MGEAIGKVILAFVDALTPRSIRLIILAAVVGNGYGWWRHEKRLDEHEKAATEFKAEVKSEFGKIGVQLQTMNDRAAEGNSQLREINQWLRSRPVR